MCTSMTSTRLADLQKSALYKNAHSAVDCTKSKIIHVASTCWKIGVLSTRPLVSLASWKSPCSSIQICHVLFSAFFFVFGVLSTRPVVASAFSKLPCCSIQICTKNHFFSFLLSLLSLCLSLSHLLCSRARVDERAGGHEGPHHGRVHRLTHVGHQELSQLQPGRSDNVATNDHGLNEANH